MLTTAYCLAYGHWTVIPHQIEESFKDMVDCGFNAVALSFSESEEICSRRAFEIQVNLAKKQGLKVFVVPSRLGGRFAGAPLMPGLWISRHPESQVPGFTGFAGPVACLENEAFCEWARGFMTMLLTDYALDGVIWDEPKAETLVSRHPDTIARYGENPTEDQMEDGFVGFLQDLTSRCLSIRSDLDITLFNQKNYRESFTRKSAAIEGIAYVGYDGNLARQSRFHEGPAWHKYRIESVWERTVSECAAAGKKTFALVENMLMPAEAMAEYEENLTAYLRDFRPDHLALYYYAHNNEDPEKVHEITRRAMQALPGS
jgi:hypothetical protein